MSPAEVLGAEVPQYVGKEGIAYAPALVGRTAGARSRKITARRLPSGPSQPSLLRRCLHRIQAQVLHPAAVPQIRHTACRTRPPPRVGVCPGGQPLRAPPGAPHPVISLCNGPARCRRAGRITAGRRSSVEVHRSVHSGSESPGRAQWLKIFSVPQMRPEITAIMVEPAGRCLWGVVCKTVGAVRASAKRRSRSWGYVIRRE